MENKGKPVTTSVPSISIKFHANAEQLEELYASDEEHGGNETSGGSSGVGGNNEAESSPLKYLPRLVKRSTSIDITPNTKPTIDASPPSDPWRFFSDIKGKITKSVEEKITEIKARNQEEGSPLRNNKDNIKDNSSVSDSEEFSESSISKTCGIVSTTEGAEMSSDDDTPSIEKDKSVDGPTTSRGKISGNSGGLRQRFRLLKSKSSREGTISRRSLAGLYNINTEKVEQALPEENEIENAVDALEDTNLGVSNYVVLKGIEQQFDNIKIDDNNIINVKEISGSEVKDVHWASNVPKTVYAPVGFVDFRTKQPSVKKNSVLPLFSLLIFMGMYILIHTYSQYIAGVMLGAAVSFFLFYMKHLLDTPTNTAVPVRTKNQNVLEVPAVEEFQPLNKYEGWVNELPNNYNPHSYHISQTQSVFLRLQGNLLRVSHTRSKVPKRALWNEPKIKPAFTHHRIYNLLGAEISLLPEGLAKKRHWSKKYPICVTLHKDQMDFETVSAISNTSKLEEEDDTSAPSKGMFNFGGKKKKTEALRFSKLTEESEDYTLDSESRTSTPSPLSPEESEYRLDEDAKALDAELKAHLHKDDEHEVIFEDEFDPLPEDWHTFTPEDGSPPTTTKLYLFGRTDREKEDWFRRLKAATHRGANVSIIDTHADIKMSSTLLEKIETETDYVKYMMIFNKVPLCTGVEYPNQKVKKKTQESDDETSSNDIQWINAFAGRVLFDCLRDESFTSKIRDKIQRKLSSIKLPYFIEGLTVTELTLGQTPPLIHKAYKPVIDERGLWVDLDITYEGMVVLILQTKLNLMKLKQPPTNVHDARCYCSECSRPKEKSAMFNSDIEDSAESSSDEEGVCLFQSATVLDPSGIPVQGLGGSSNTSKKFMKMVDKIAESKFFQAATEYRYIKKAMEGVSNTELRLRVEVKELIGTLVLNIPTPPSDRIWIGFRPTPDLNLSAQPIVGERNITFLRITSWIEKKLLLEFQKLLVIPNMEDFIVPVMSPKLPH